MSTISFKKIKLADAELSRFQGNVSDVIAPLVANPTAGAVLVNYSAPVVIAPGTDIVIGHKLGGKYKGVIPLLAVLSSKATGNASWAISATPNVNPQSFVILQCSARLLVGASFTFLVF